MDWFWLLVYYSECKNDINLNDLNKIYCVDKI